VLTPPFTNLRTFNTPNIGSTPVFICGSTYAMHVDSISFCNTSDNDLLFDIKEVGENEEIYRVYHRLLKANETLDVELSTLEYLMAGNLLYANSDFSGSRFDSKVSCREQVELGGA